MKKIFAFRILIACLLVCSLVSCSDYGKKVKISGTKGEVYYKGEGITESDATKVGDFLKETGYLSNEKGASIQISKVGERYVVRFVYNKEYFEKKKELENFFKTYGVKMSKEVFGGSKVDILLTNEKFEDFKSIPYDVSMEQTKPNEEETKPGPPTEEEKPSLADFDHDKAGGVEFFWKGVSDKDSKTIADYIVQNGSFAGGSAQIYITKNGDRYILRFPVALQYRNDEATINEIQKVSKQIKENVFPNTPYSFQMTDEQLNAVKSFDY